VALYFSSKHISLLFQDFREIAQLVYLTQAWIYQTTKRRSDEGTRVKGDPKERESFSPASFFTSFMDRSEEKVRRIAYLGPLKR